MTTKKQKLLNYKGKLNELLNEKELTKLLLISHHIYWPIANYLRSEYNCDVSLTGPVFDYDYYQTITDQLDDYDLIFCYGVTDFKQDTFKSLHELAVKISNYQNKTVTIGYASFIPQGEVKDYASCRLMGMNVSANDQSNKVYYSDYLLQDCTIKNGLDFLAGVHSEEAKNNSYQLVKQIKHINNY